jgi:hypothetical protein
LCTKPSPGPSGLGLQTAPSAWKMIYASSLVHAKFMVLFFPRYLRLVIASGNFTQVEYESIRQVRIFSLKSCLHVFYPFITSRLFGTKIFRNLTKGHHARRQSFQRNYPSFCWRLTSLTAQLKVSTTLTSLKLRRPLSHPYPRTRPRYRPRQG